MDNLSSEKIITDLIQKASLKQDIYKTTFNAFNMFKKELVLVNRWVKVKTRNCAKPLKIKYSESGDFETELKFATDTLVFMMHTNVFNFPDDHIIFKNQYVKEDNRRSYCGTILIYNFLSDSIFYNRTEDLGYLIARIFINKDNHFFIQGQRQYSFMFRDFANLMMDKNNVRDIILTSIQLSIEFDLLVPPFETINQLTIAQKVQTEGNFALKTGKRVGFTMQSGIKDIE